MGGRINEYLKGFHYLFLGISLRIPIIHFEKERKG
jgi:hypothetical protein